MRTPHERRSSCRTSGSTEWPAMRRNMHWRANTGHSPYWSLCATDPVCTSAMAASRCTAVRGIARNSSFAICTSLTDRNGHPVRATTTIKEKRTMPNQATRR
eukprot:TRINITY_DN3797_c0_g1_i2.p3 TRINITY_DN3797_c0_g1~~TRINITY_DN3797_c0_g1_i2.p3  ORF type:complete len:102 (+),score=4.08 TRINITY_DN3797_c0_g1_i2:82-387(+)